MTSRFSRFAFQVAEANESACRRTLLCGWEDEAGTYEPEHEPGTENLEV